MPIENRKIPINELELWDENARFPDKYFNKPEEELIDYFLSKKEFKILDLLKEMVDDFDLPQVEKLIVWINDEGKNIVIEGNRRLVCYKILCNPSIIKKDNIKKKVEELSKAIDINGIQKLECLISNNQKELFPYLNRKHLKGNNEVSWQEQERTNHKNRIGKANRSEKFRIEIGKIISKLEIPENQKEQILGKGFQTNFWRIIDSAPSWNKYNFKMNENGLLTWDYKDFEDELIVIIHKILNWNGTSEMAFSRVHNKNPEKEKFINSINSGEVAEILKANKEEIVENIFGEKITLSKKKNSKKSFPNSATRTYLIPKTCVLYIESKRINTIYYELKENLEVDKVPNAVGVLFRVFLEVSLDFYAEKNGKTFGRNDTITKKIEYVISNLKEKGLTEKNIYEYINKVANAKKENTYLSIDNFHEYVHSTTTEPSGSELKTKWNMLEKFFLTLWDNI